MSPRLVASAMAALVLSAAPGFGQTKSTPAPSTPAPSTPSTPAPSTPSTPAPTTRTPTPLPLPGTGTTSRSPTPDDLTRPSPGSQIALSGKVLMEDGTAPPEPAGIESVCGTQHTRTLVYTDSKGGFSLGSGMSDVADARSPGRGGSSSSAVGVPRSVSSGLSPNCRIRATLPGYRSTEVDLSFRMRGDPTPLTIVLHPTANIEGRTVSATSIDAPKEARAAFDKAGRAIAKQKWDEAGKHLERAVEAYPRYAAAWSDLGNAYSERDQPDKARKAYQRAIEIDPKFVNPYLGLAQLAMHEKKWDEMAALTAKLIKMNPYDVPAAYALDAMAHLNRNDLEAAEKSARQGLEVDTARSVPKIEHLLGVVLMRKRNFRAAAEHLNKYLQARPDAPDAEFVRRQLAACEKPGA